MNYWDNMTPWRAKCHRLIHNLSSQAYKAANPVPSTKVVTMLNAVEFGRCYSVTTTEKICDYLRVNSEFWADPVLSDAWDLEIHCNLVFFNCMPDHLEKIVEQVNHYILRA